tara:strand:- start:49 stop:429 length:381 start_codon:yes stop_codon:yes gene_type:complete
MVVLLLRLVLLIASRTCLHHFLINSQFDRIAKLHPLRFHLLQLPCPLHTGNLCPQILLLLYRDPLRFDLMHVLATSQLPLLLFSYQLLLLDVGFKLLGFCLGVIFTLKPFSFVLAFSSFLNLFSLS